VLGGDRNLIRIPDAAPRAGGGRYFRRVLPAPKKMTIKGRVARTSPYRLVRQTEPLDYVSGAYRVPGPEHFVGPRPQRQLNSRACQVGIGLGRAASRWAAVAEHLEPEAAHEPAGMQPLRASGGLAIPDQATILKAWIRSSARSGRVCKR
jgi:hypothetical protein